MGAGFGGKGFILSSGGGESAIRRLTGDTVRVRRAGAFGFATAAGLSAVGGAGGRPRGRVGERVFLAGEAGKGGASAGGAERGCLDEERVARVGWTGSAAFFLGEVADWELPMVTPTPCLSVKSCVLVFLGDFGLVGDFGFVVAGVSVSVSVPEW
jgi:hypothetical protein